MPMTEVEISDLQARIGKLPATRAGVLADARHVSESVSVAKLFRNHADAATDARRALALVYKFNSAVGSLRREVQAAGMAADQLAVFDAMLIPLAAYHGRELYGCIGRQVQAERKAASESRQRLKKLHTRKPGEVFKLDSSAGLAQFAVSSPNIDLEARSITLTVCTAEPDCDDEVILPQGIRLDRFEQNAVALWEHGFGDVRVPIGKWQHSDGRLSLETKGDVMTGTCYLARGVPEADKIWSLVMQGVVRAASVHVVPIEFEFRTIGERHVKVYTASELLEISLVSIPCNPQATRKAAGDCGCQCRTKGGA
jgi:HK97 family phage prohead protease